MGIITSGAFILASKSPRRIELLNLMGIKHLEVIPSKVKETFLSGENPDAHVRRLSKEKAETLACLYPKAWVLGADTIVVIDGEILGKPHNPSEAGEMLRKLSGREHRVFTGFTVINNSLNILIGDCVESTVLFRNLGEDEIQWYIDTPEPHDKAGGYAVQGIGAFFIKEIHGSYTNVMGLPLCEVVDVLKKSGAIRFS
ncbi:MAG: septum formation inhibitor Maf [Deltaproteobacteria bacterium]|nr:septum formation inhibitor Maf [Deltaproteobacteria bacterium]